MFGERHGLGGAGVNRAEHHVIEQFQLVAVPERPDVEQFFFRSAEYEEHILDLGEGLIRTAERKSPASHPGRAAHDRCVHKINAFGGQRLAHANVHARIDRAHVDDHGALGGPGCDPALAEHDLFRVGGAGDEHQDDPGLARQFRRGTAHAHPGLGSALDGRRIRIVPGHGNPAFHQFFRAIASHNPQSYNAYGIHIQSLLESEKRYDFSPPDRAGRETVKPVKRDGSGGTPGAATFWRWPCGPPWRCPRR